MNEKVMTGEDEDRKVAPTDEDLKVIEVDAQGEPLESSQDDERLSGEDEGDGDPSRPVRKRETHQERRERHRRARERDQREINFLRNEVQRLGMKVENSNQVVIDTRVQSLDSRLAEHLRDAETAERIEAAAIKAQNGEDAVNARRIREDALAKARAVAVEKESIANGRPTQQPGQPQAPEFLPLVKEFAKDKPWFTWDMSDPDSAVVLALDNQVAREGYHPNTPAYWAELDRRVKERLPHKFGSGAESGQDDALDEDSDNDSRSRTGRRGPPVGAGRQHAPESTRREVYISPERKQAMIEAGVWDDPVLRKRYVKSYAEWDRNNTARR